MLRFDIFSNLFKNKCFLKVIICVFLLVDKGMREVYETVTKTSGLYTRTVTDLNQIRLSVLYYTLCSQRNKFLIPLVYKKVKVSVI